MMPELFVQLYYNSAPFKKALLQVWAKSKRARVHTDLLVIDGPRDAKLKSIQKCIFAPENSRPWGIYLPTTHSLCGCRDYKSRWKLRYMNISGKYGECFYCYRATCGHSDIALAVFTQGLKQLEIDGTHIVVKHYNASSRCFPMDGHDYYKIKAAVRVPFPVTDYISYSDTQLAPTAREMQAGAKRTTFMHDSPWTIAGQTQAQRRS